MPQVLKTIFITEFAIYNAMLAINQIKFLDSLATKFFSNIIDWAQKSNRSGIALLVGSLKVLTTSMIAFGAVAMVPIALAMQAMSLYADKIKEAFKATMMFGGNLKDNLRESILSGLVGVSFETIMRARQGLASKLMGDASVNQMLLMHARISPYALRTMNPAQQLDTVIHALMRIQDITMRTALATKLLGTEWSEILYAQIRMKEVGATGFLKDIDMKTLHDMELGFIRIKIAVMEAFFVIARDFGPALTELFGAMRAIIGYLITNWKWLAIAIGLATMAFGALTLNPLQLLMGLALTSFGIAGLFQKPGAVTGTNPYEDVLFTMNKQTGHLSNIDRNTTELANSINDFIFTTAAGPAPFYQHDILRALVTNAGG